MSGHTVEEIGDTSMATAPLFDNVPTGGHGGPELYNRPFVACAFAGMTGLLLKPNKTGQPGVYAPFPRKEPAWREALDRVHDAMRERNAVMFPRCGSLRLAFRPIASTAAA